MATLGAIANIGLQIQLIIKKSTRYNPHLHFTGEQALTHTRCDLVYFVSFSSTLKIHYEILLFFQQGI